MHVSRRVAISTGSVGAACGVAIVATVGAFQASAAAPVLRIAPAVASARPSQTSQRSRRGAYALVVAVEPNRSTTINRLTVRLTRDGHAVAGARVTVDVRMLEMAMSAIRMNLRPAAGGSYVNTDTALGMIGRWGLRVSVAPSHGGPFIVQLVDQDRS